MKVTLLGTGTSTGIPVPTCSCEVCTSDDPRDRRMRCACLVELDGLSILIDAGPDLRAQCLTFGIQRIDAVLLTHEHFDHVAGLDDLRAFILRRRVPIPIFTSSRTAAILRKRMDYIFEDGSYPGVPKLDLVEVNSTFSVAGRYDQSDIVQVDCIEAFHGEMPVTGFRIGKFAYVTDVSRLPESSIRRLEGVDLLVLSALRLEPHPTHFTFDEAVAAAQRIGARKTYFVHMTHSILHGRESRRLPSGIELGYDGLSAVLAD
jgi:phosphoribosyl 1,2-cyclic phosphate phosphodiesterase